jgi:hypothetical protein
MVIEIGHPVHLGHLSLAGRLAGICIHFPLEARFKTVTDKMPMVRTSRLGMKSKRETNKAAFSHLAVTPVAAKMLMEFGGNPSYIRTLDSVWMGSFKPSSLLSVGRSDWHSWTYCGVISPKRQIKSGAKDQLG